MCLAIPGKVVEVNGEDVIVDYVAEKRNAKCLLDIKEGEYVIVSGGFVVTTVPEDEALKTIELIASSG